MNTTIPFPKGTLIHYLHNPLGIIGLFVTSCYLIGGLVFSIGLDKLKGSSERLPFIYFLILFPILILGIFVYLVCCHHEKLYSPSDFHNENNFVKLSGKEIKKKIQEDAKETVLLEDDIPTKSFFDKLDKDVKLSIGFHIENAFHLAIMKLMQIYGIPFDENVKYDSYSFDAVGFKNGFTYIVECKYVKGNVSKSRLYVVYQEVCRYKQVLHGNNHIIIAIILDKFTSETERRIIDYYNLLSPELLVEVFDYSKLKDAAHINEGQ
jgi:hypothetical protein